MTWVGKERVIQLLFGIVAIEGYLQYERAVNLKNNLFPFPLATAFLIGDVMTNRC